MNLSNKYAPYQGYGTTQPFAWVSPPKRIRTKSDWRVPHDAARAQRLGLPYEPWKRWPKRSRMSVWEKRYVHRQFRQATRRAVARELGGDEGVSYNFRATGDYLD